MKRNSFVLILAMLFSLILGTQTVQAAGSFNQGNQYSSGLYNLNATQASAFNWTRQSRFLGSLSNTLKWSYDTGGTVRSSPAIGSDGTIYVGSYDNKVYGSTATITAGKGLRRVVTWKPQYANIKIPFTSNKGRNSNSR